MKKLNLFVLILLSIFLFSACDFFDLIKATGNFEGTSWKFESSKDSDDPEEDIVAPITEKADFDSDGSIETYYTDTYLYFSGGKFYYCMRMILDDPGPTEGEVEAFLNAAGIELDTLYSYSENMEYEVDGNKLTLDSTNISDDEDLVLGTLEYEVEGDNLIFYGLDSSGKRTTESMIYVETDDYDEDDFINAELLISDLP